jgi:hypothetical protein
VREITVHRMVSPTPEADTALAVSVLESLTEGDAKLRQRRIGQYVVILITGRPWLVLPRLTVRRGKLTAGWLLWILHIGKKRKTT